MHDENDYFLTQFLSGHGGFQSYQHKIRNMRSPDCVFCNGVVDDGHHSFFSCGKWYEIRQLFKHRGSLSNYIVEEMLRSDDRWSRVAYYVRVLLVTKKIKFDRWRSWMAGGSPN